MSLLLLLFKTTLIILPFRNSSLELRSELRYLLGILFLIIIVKDVYLLLLLLKYFKRCLSFKIFVEYFLIVVLTGI